MTSPILFIIFKRYDTALEVFKQIRLARPPKLYIAADAPRYDSEVMDCEHTRSIVSKVDWDCEVKTLFQTKNQGCGIGPYKAISWFFENEEQGIVLEDDCVPNPDFFIYCDDLLNRYKYNDKISVISGRNVLGKYENCNDSYFLSGLHFCWGWASWRRVWNFYDYYLDNVKLLSYTRHLYNLFGNKPLLIMWRLSKFFQCKTNPQLDAWDYQFAISTQILESYTIVPRFNLVHNVGFDERATHTSEINFCDIPSYPILPLRHPDVLKYSNLFDNSVKRTGNPIRFVGQFIKILIKYLIKQL